MKLVKKNGLTIIELLVVVAIIILLASVVLPSFKDFREDRVLKSATEDVLATLDRAHSQTLSSLESSTYGIHFESDKMVVFKGDTYSESDPDNSEISIQSPATISDISLTDDAVDVYFSRLKGLPSVSGTITISTNSLSKVITVSPTGTFSVN